jgi:hypothetical protein
MQILDIQSMDGNIGLSEEPVGHKFGKKLARSTLRMLIEFYLLGRGKEW